MSPTLRYHFLLRIAVLVLLAAFALPLYAKGALVLSGGKLPNEVLKQALTLAGGTDIRVVILPFASNNRDRGMKTARMLRQLGVDKVDIMQAAESQDTRLRIARADLIWLTGGKQRRLMEELEAAGLAALIRERFDAGVTLGGSSAGAAVVSEIMIATTPERQVLLSGNTPVLQGLGLVPELIIDQHFVARHRFNRLLGAVVDHRDRIGVGIDEKTGVVITDGLLSVIGDGSVVVVDPRDASFKPADPGDTQHAEGLRVHVLRDGDSFGFR